MIPEMAQCSFGWGSSELVGSRSFAKEAVSGVKWSKHEEGPPVHAGCVMTCFTEWVVE